MEELVKNKESVLHVFVNQVSLVNIVNRVECPGFAIDSLESFLFEEFFRCQANGRFADPTNCKQGRYFECVYFGQCKLENVCQSIE